MPSVFSCVASRNKRYVSNSQLPTFTPNNLTLIIGQPPAARRVARAGATPAGGTPASPIGILSSVGRTPGSTAVSLRTLRASRGEASGPRDSSSRKSSAQSTAPIRPVAHSPEALCAWATRPAVRRTARALPVRPRRVPSRRYLRALRNSKLYPKTEAGGP